MHPRPTTRHLVSSSAVMGLGALIITVSSSALSTALPTLARVFDVDPSVVAWVVLVNTLVTVSTLAIFGRLSDILGKKALFAWGAGVTVVSSVLCAFSPTLGWLLVFRVVQAVGTTILNAVPVAYLVAIFPPTRRGTVVAFWEIAISLGLGIGPVVGGLLLAEWNWRAVMLVPVPLGLLALALVPRAMLTPPPASGHQRFDMAGAVLLAASIGTLMFALTRGAEDGWGSAVIAGCLIASAATAAAFVVVERRVRNPMVDLSLFSSMTFSAGNAAKVAGYAPFAATQFLIPFYLDEALHLDPAALGLTLAAYPVGMLLGSALSGPLSDRVGTRLLAPAGLLASAASALLLAIIQSEQGVPPVLIATFLGGFGLGVFIAPNDSAIMSATAMTKMGVANGIMGVSRSLGVAGGGAMAAGLLTARISANGGAFVPSFHQVFVVVVAVAAVGVVLAALRDHAADRTGVSLSHAR